MSQKVCCVKCSGTGLVNLKDGAEGVCHECGNGRGWVDQERFDYLYPTAKFPGYWIGKAESGKIARPFALLQLQRLREDYPMFLRQDVTEAWKQQLAKVVLEIHDWANADVHRRNGGKVTGWADRINDIIERN